MFWNFLQRAPACRSQPLSSKKLKIKVKQFFLRSCVTTFIKIQTKTAATKLCEILKYELKTFKEGINKKKQVQNEGIDGQT